MKVGIVGAGIGGLAIAIRMAVGGHEVTVFEKNGRPGGKLSEIRLGPFRFDTGPSLFTLPDLVGELFALCGKEMKKELPHTLLPINCRYYFPDGTHFNFYHNKELLQKELAGFPEEDRKQITKRLEQSKEVYEMSAPIFLFSPFGELSQFITPPYKRLALKLHKLDFFRTIHRANRKDFKDKRLVQLFDRYATYNGSDPYRAPATLNMIAHLENNIGAFFPDKGMYSIVESLYELAKEMNVQFHFDDKVEEIVCSQGKAIGLRTGEGSFPYDIIVSDVDARYVANKLMDKHPLQKRLNRMEPSSSAMIFYWGMNRTFPDLELHNIFFSADYQEEFNQLFAKHQLADDLTVYLFISNKLVKTDAPEGCENWFVMVNAPVDQEQDWEEQISSTRRKILRKLNKYLDVDLEDHILAEEVVTPSIIERNTGSVGGALYGSSSNSMFSAFLRHPNRLKKTDNLYFVGGSVHPGGGIPLCLASACIVEQQIKERYE